MFMVLLIGCLVGVKGAVLREIESLPVESGLSERPTETSQEARPDINTTATLPKSNEDNPVDGDERNVQGVPEKEDSIVATTPIENLDSLHYYNNTDTDTGNTASGNEIENVDEINPDVSSDLAAYNTNETTIENNGAIINGAKDKNNEDSSLNVGPGIMNNTSSKTLVDAAVGDIEYKPTVHNVTFLGYTITENENTYHNTNESVSIARQGTPSSENVEDEPVNDNVDMSLNNDVELTDRNSPISINDLVNNINQNASSNDFDGISDNSVNEIDGNDVSSEDVNIKANADTENENISENVNDFEKVKSSDNDLILDEETLKDKNDLMNTENDGDDDGVKGYENGYESDTEEGYDYFNITNVENGSDPGDDNNGMESEAEYENKNEEGETVNDESKSEYEDKIDEDFENNEDDDNDNEDTREDDSEEDEYDLANDDENNTKDNGIYDNDGQEEYGIGSDTEDEDDGLDGNNEVDSEDNKSEDEDYDSSYAYYEDYGDQRGFWDSLRSMFGFTDENNGTIADAESNSDEQNDLDGNITEPHYESELNEDVELSDVKGVDQNGEAGEDKSVKDGELSWEPQWEN